SGGAARAPRVDWDELGRAVATVQRALDTVVTGLSGPAGDGAAGVDAMPRVEGTSGKCRVVVRFVAGQLAEVAVGERWLVDAGRQQIADSLREAFEAAYAAGADEPAAADAGGVDGGTALGGELRAILDRMGCHLPTPEGGARPRYTMQSRLERIAHAAALWTDGAEKQAAAAPAAATLTTATL